MSTSGAPIPAATATAVLCVILLSAPSSSSVARAQQCGSQAGGALCRDCLCCSQFGFCGSTDPYCGAGCQSQCTGCATPPPSPPASTPGTGVASLIPRDLFERLLLHRNDAACLARGFYTYDAFLAAAAAFRAFATTGGDEQRKREVAAFLGQTSHETTGGWPTAPDGPFSWSYCFNQELTPPSDYCSPRPEWPCAPGKKYFGRGPIQLSYNYNYGPAGRAIGVDLLNNPELVATDAVVSFKTALWFWMTARDNKPSCHAVINGEWTPTDADRAAGRGAPGYGVITNIINGGFECGHGPDTRAADRIGFYKRYCDAFRIGYGSSIGCDGQRPFNAAVAVGLTFVRCCCLDWGWW
ncbi:hypothetical protein HU200_024582 [Digitaria exilis]|uniref:chitinase n=1 Tax=Digitaria exilis TaxID=1010633 RepID=A0A835EY76_9POAL|nr:hypothetical protein HU200_024582 [Digitaria exilis]